METFIKQREDAGSNVVSKPDPYDARGEGVMSIIGARCPDSVRLPPELGGQMVKVLASGNARCPKGCGDHLTHHLDGDYYVCECPTHGYLWYRLKPMAGTEGMPTTPTAP